MKFLFGWVSAIVFVWFMESHYQSTRKFDLNEVKLKGIVLCIENELVIFSSLRHLVEDQNRTTIPDPECRENEICVVPKNYSYEISTRAFIEVHDDLGKIIKC